MGKGQKSVDCSTWSVEIEFITNGSVRLKGINQQKSKMDQTLVSEEWVMCERQCA
jgi:hypothetical protein